MQIQEDSHDVRTERQAAEASNVVNTPNDLDEHEITPGGEDFAELAMQMYTECRSTTDQATSKDGSGELRPAAEIVSGELEYPSSSAATPTPSENLRDSYECDITTTTTTPYTEAQRTSPAPQARRQSTRLLAQRSEKETEQALQNAGTDHSRSTTEANATPRSRGQRLPTPMSPSPAGGLRRSSRKLPTSAPAK